MTRELVFDTTALNYFALAGELDLLEQMVESFRCVAPSEVLNELAAGVAAHPELRDTLNLPWIGNVQLSASDLALFARYKRELGGGPSKNLGEAAVLAWCASTGGTAIIDESRARDIAHQDGIAVHGSLWLIQLGVKSNLLDRSAAITLIDQLRSAGMYLPRDSAALVA
ncbi:hypothetical protein [Candidatus Poriferisodalis sp.]|uniref:hypothetical protein n=1 Tax=Candidatus Poriferisodalis sp. TaxID=3101277 RepID=UPI003B5C9019